MSKAVDYMETIPAVELGMGYSSELSKTTSNFCIDASTVRKYGKSHSTVDLSLSKSSAQKVDNLEFSGALSFTRKAGPAELTVDVEGSYQSNTAETEYSYSFTFSSQVEFPSQILHVSKYGSDALTEFGKAVLTTNPNGFKEVCGDKFVVQEKSGAQLKVTVTIDFSSKASKEAFDVSGSVDIMTKAGISASAEASFGLSSSSANDSSSVKVQAYQQGGNIMRLAKILGDSDENASVTCRLTDEAGIKKCNELTNAILNYAKKDFAEQITYSSSAEGGIEGMPSPIGYVYNTYQSIGVNPSALASEGEIEEIKEYLNKAVKKLEKISDYLLHLVFSGKVGGPITQSFSEMYWNKASWDWNPNLLTSTGRANLENAHGASKKLLGLLLSDNKGVNLCIKNPAKCSEVESNLIAMIDNIDNSSGASLADSIVGRSNIDNVYDYTEPFNTFKKVYKMYVDCNKNGVGDIKDLYSGRVLLPLGEDKYLENSIYIHTENGIDQKRSFHNEYEILLNEDKSTISNFKVRYIDSVNISISSYSDCGEYAKKEGMVIPFFDMSITDINCIKAICGADADTSSAVIELYQADTPI